MTVRCSGLKPTYEAHNKFCGMNERTATLTCCRTCVLSRTQVHVFWVGGREGQQKTLLFSYIKHRYIHIYTIYSIYVVLKFHDLEKGI